jgi:hypothetical protein
MYRQKEKPNDSRPLGCWQIAGVALVVLLVFLLLYEPITNLLR